MIENAFIRAVDARGKEITKFSLSGDASMNGMCSMVLQKHTGMTETGNSELWANLIEPIILLMFSFLIRINKEKVC